MEDTANVVHFSGTANFTIGFLLNFVMDSANVVGEFGQECAELL